MSMLKSIQEAILFVLGTLKLSSTRRISMPINKGPVPNTLMTNQLQRGTNVIIVINHMPTRGICRPTLNKNIHCSDRNVFHSDWSSYSSDRFVHRSNRSSSTVFTVYYVFHPVLSFLPGCLFVNVHTALYLHVPCSAKVRPLIQIYI